MTRGRFLELCFAAMAGLSLLSLAGCGGSEEGTAPRAAGGATLEGTTLDGDRISLADFRGTPVFVNVWSSW